MTLGKGNISLSSLTFLCHAKPLRCVKSKVLCKHCFPPSMSIFSNAPASRFSEMYNDPEELKILDRKGLPSLNVALGVRQLQLSIQMWWLIRCQFVKYTFTYKSTRRRLDSFNPKKINRMLEYAQQCTVFILL